jgi:methylthioribose-1-phosphate isomerase
MAKQTIEQIKKRLIDDTSIPEEKRSELIALLDKLEAEVASLENTHKEDAGSIAMFAASSAHEAMRKVKNKKLLDLSIEGLKTSVQKFENSHPKLVQVVNAISTTLSNLGI